MSPLKLAAFRLPDDLLTAMESLKERDGMPYADQVRRALEAFLTDRGVIVAKSKKKSERPRVAARKRP